MEPNALSMFLGTWGYLALLALLILTGVGSPIPEDLLLLTAGYLVSVGVFEWPLALGTGAVGVVVSDLMLYSAGRHVAWRSARWPEGYFLSAERLQRATRWFARCGPVVVLIARLVPGTRAIVFVTAGIHSIPMSRFLGYDILGAAVWVPAAVAFGNFAGRHFGDLASVMDWLDRAGTGVAIVACALLLTWFWLGREESKL
jgi:membrane protein DedA with SNARE-associated domain